MSAERVERVIVTDEDFRRAVRSFVEVSVPVAARMLGVSRRYVRMLLNQHPDRFQAPRLKRLRRRWTRIITPDEFDTLKSMIGGTETRPARALVKRKST